MIKIFINPKSCLDVGCSMGRMVRYLRLMGIDAYGVEISKEALESAMPSVKKYIREGSITGLPFKDSEFDLVTSFDVLEHLERSKIETGVNECVRVARKHVLHKIYTVENGWIRMLHTRDFSRISVFSRSYWDGLFTVLKNAAIEKKYFPRLPAFFETLYLLKKKD